MFFLHGGTQSDLGLEHRHEGQTGHSLRTVLLAFMRKMRAVVQMHVVPHSQVFFKASKSTGLRCKAIGYRNHCACITGLPALGDDQAIQLTQHMVGLRHSFSNNSRKLFMDNLLQLPLRKFSYRGVVPAAWNNTASLFPCVTNTQVNEWFQQWVTPEPSQCESKAQLLLACPVCSCIKDCANQLLLKGTAWRTITCTSSVCKMSRTSAKWSCACGIPWYLCKTHAPIGHAAGRLRKSPLTGEASRAVGTGAQVSGFSGCGGSAPQSLPARPRPSKRRWTSVTHGISSSSQIHDNSNSLGSQLERVCRRRHQADCHETFDPKPSTRKRRVQPHANCTGNKNKKRKLDQHDNVIAAIERMREGALDQDLGLGRSM